ncbi:transcriptional regulator, LacI family [Actinacidiphila yanglinensis]|uniref:Transcriptional regulator, LacI family n=1 Tax=Actinacidiphila yanglinensis TaxID=310779 RepID=A0A1H6DBS6_9ACTN|nr:LacI family DNA-binding transcriptional regulator [Actinacidiphila yanglinensis]SEG81916.1 transcriptional regulator, LacI family [Actinacidiphila yanglinensis]
MSRADGPPNTEENPPNRRTVTIRDVAAEAQVSLGTVSNVLNRSNAVAPEKRQRVLDAIDTLGFVKHAGAALMRGGKARTIGLVALDVRNPFFTELARGAEDAARENGRLLILCNSDEDAEQERSYLELLAEQRVLGVVISPVDERNETLSWLRERGTAVVLLGRPRQDYCSVRVDDVAGGRLAAEHLLDLGHRRLAYVTAPLTIEQYQERLEGVRQALRGRGLAEDSCRVIEVGSLGTAAEGRLASARLREEYPEVTGVACGNDLLALGVVGGLLRQGVRVPEDVSVVGFDDIEMAEQNPLPLTTIRQPKAELGYVATNLLLDEAQRGGVHAHREVMFQPELVVRETTRAPAGEASP